MRTAWQQLVRGLHEGFFSPRGSQPRKAFYQPRVECLDDRIVPATNVWIESTGGGTWTTPSNWSLGHEPVAGEDVLFPGSSTSYCSLDVATPLLNSVTFSGGWNGYLGLTNGFAPDVGTLNAKTITLNARGSGAPQYTIYLQDDCAVNCTEAVNFYGGGIGNDPGNSTGEIHVTGALNVGGTSSSDKPTLGSLLYLDGGAAMEFTGNSVPLVVEDSCDIVVNAGATLDFSGAAAGQAIDSDGGEHTIIVDGGRMEATINSIEVEVEMLVRVEDGEFVTDGDETGVLHFTALKDGGDEVWIAGGAGGDYNSNVTIDGGLKITGGGLFDRGKVFQRAGKTLTVGAVSGAGVTINGGVLDLLGTLVSAGDVIVTGNAQSPGLLSTRGTTASEIQLGSGSVFRLQAGGIVEVTRELRGVGTLTVNGTMEISGGHLWINCDSTDNTSGKLIVNSYLVLTEGNTAVLHAKDVDLLGNGMEYDAIVTPSDGGGDFSLGDLPPTGGGEWRDGNSIFHVWS